MCSVVFTLLVCLVPLSQTNQFVPARLRGYRREPPSASAGDHSRVAGLTGKFAALARRAEQPRDHCHGQLLVCPEGKFFSDLRAKLDIKESQLWSRRSEVAAALFKNSQAVLITALLTMTATAASASVDAGTGGDAGAYFANLFSGDVSLLDAYMSLLVKHPLSTKAVTAALLAALGDALAQFKEQQVKLEQSHVAIDKAIHRIQGNATVGVKERADQFTFDLRRSYSFALFGATYTGAFQNFLFPWLEDHFQGDLLAAVLMSRGFEVDHQLLAAVERTCANQLACIPLLYYPTYFAITSALNGLNATRAVTRARKLFLPLMRRNLAFWIPVQFTQFATVPTALQVPFVCVAGLVWNAILSASSGSPAGSKQSASGRTAPSKA